ncbi:GNAT family N-acetyltransferase [Flavobacterium supellecticarium]|uniref:GNAT family N-acetyltransferase n=1 Tax=Flavobacterium supellecticarium TaxID=2565924 RepID=A0A4S3ZYY3_9FLAO|nr:GNAT family N-acetyltransferase [Flavobacterium supellecticarium]THF51178.1 GNAT family N-acetyltransferase [Flavobacterium supellecticarium]
MIFVKKINSTTTFQVRQPVLRPGKPIESCIFEGDDLETTTHLGLYNNSKLAGIVSIFASCHKLFPQVGQFQLRGMAVLDEFQKKGYGERLVSEAEVCIKEQNGSLIWFNAREAAVDFYKKMGYEIVGDAFDIPTIGIHFVMRKMV